MFGGAVLISGVIGEGAYGEDPALGALFGVLTAVAYTGFLLVLRHAGRDLRRPAGPLFEATLVATVVAIAAGALLGEVDLVPSWPAHGWLLTLALTSQVLGWLLIAVALPRLPASLTSIVLTVQPVGSVVLGTILSAARVAWTGRVGESLLESLRELLGADAVRLPDPYAVGADVEDAVAAGDDAS